MTYPDWTERVTGLSSHRGLWPLGLEPVGFSFARQLLPGLTNVTTNIRYYSFFCWAFWTFEKHLRDRGTAEFHPADQKRWLARLENVFRAATLHSNPDVLGLAGVTDTVRLGEADDSLAVDATDVPSGFVPALYSASWRNLRCGKSTARGVGLSPELGRPLARAYQETLERAASRREVEMLLSSASQGPTVPAALVRKLADAMALRPVAPDEPEHEKLRELLFRTERQGSNPEWRRLDASRSRSLALLLEFGRQGRGTIRDRFDIHRIFASGLLPDKRRFEVPAPYQDDFLIWQRYQERQYERIALYGFWVLVYKALHARRRTPREICRWVRADLERSPVLAEWLGRDPLRMTVGDAEQVILARYRNREYPDLAADDLRVRILEAEPQADRAGAALLLLLLIVVVWRERRGDLPRWACGLHKRYGRERLDLEVLLEDLEGRQTESLGDLVDRVVEVYVLSQSLRVALEKFARGEYRFFIARDQDGFRIVRKENAAGHLGYDQPRLQGAYSLLQGLGLIDLDAGYEITAAGENLLKELQGYHTESRALADSTAVA